MGSGSHVSVMGPGCHWRGATGHWGLGVGPGLGPVVVPVVRAPRGPWLEGSGAANHRVAVHVRACVCAPARCSAKCMKVVASDRRGVRARASGTRRAWVARATVCEATCASVRVFSRVVCRGSASRPCRRQAPGATAACPYYGDRQGLKVGPCTFPAE